jgi:hypothetical protein
MTTSPPVGVACRDAEVASWLADWLSGMRLEPPVPLALDVHIVENLPADDDPREPFLQPLVEIRSGAPLDDVRIRWRAGEARATIAPGARTALVELTRDALRDRDRLTQTFLTATLVFLLRRAGWHHVHAAVARDPRGRDWLFAGDAESGKSTTAALLATRGWAVGSDDLTFLAQNGNGVTALAQRSPIALRPGGYALLGLAGGAAARGGRKSAFFPEELGGSWAGQVTPQILALPRVEGSLTRLEPVRPREALAELVRWSAWVALEPALAQEHLDLLAALARQARCYRLFLGPDLFGGRDVLMELMP